ncbi:YpmS family protein [Indiicoccus explosivorum]|uniref:YpmS family protein n=1 Tax=Indiicoccus explosivorum TaxID=1917864 RepID=UPI000B43AD21|nr:YpmS family protein [Indiicoccus explosivorum]
MNRWKIAFFTLFSAVIAGLLLLVFAAVSPSDDFVSYESGAKATADGNSLVIRTTKEDFEGIANTLIRKEMGNQKFPLTLSVDDDVSLSTELDVFSVTLPILLTFEPVVQPDGSLLLEQKSVKVGMLDIPPSQALKLLEDSVDLPEFMEVRTGDEEILLQLPEIPLESGMTVEAMKFNLQENDIRLRVTIQN